MAKVVTSQGLNEFVQSGKHETIVDKAKEPPSKEAPPLELIKPPAEAEKAKDDAPPDDDPETQAEIEKSERFRKTINKKHRAMREAQEAAAEAERFAENQYNRARLAEERAERLERELREKAPPKATEPEARKPTHDEKNADGTPKWYTEKGEFKAFEYAEALAGFAATEAVAKDRAKQVEEAQKAAAAAAEEVAKSHVAESRKLHADYDEVMASADVKTHSAVLQYMTASDHIGEIAYYLAKNPDYVERINKLNPLKAIAEIGKLELTFEKKPEPVKTDAPPPPKAGAPAPIQPLKTTSEAIVQTDPSKMGFRQLRDYERQRSRRH